MCYTSAMKRRMMALLIALCLCLGASALAEEQQTFTLGSRGEGVVRLQQRLMDLGYYFHKPTGSYQAVTRRAVLAYERACGARQDGQLTPEEQTTLFSAYAQRAPFEARVKLSFTAQSASFSLTGALVSWDRVKTQLVPGESYTVYNCDTGESCQLIYQGGTGHAHMVPDSFYQNGRTMTKWMGESNSYYKIAVAVDIGGQLTAASLQYDNTTAHVYFEGSLSEVLGLRDVEHESLIKRAAGR